MSGRFAMKNELLKFTNFFSRVAKSEHNFIFTLVDFLLLRWNMIPLSTFNVSLYRKEQSIIMVLFIR